MAIAMLRILLVDDDEDDYFLIREMVARALPGQAVIEWSRSFLEGQAAMQTQTFDVVLAGEVINTHNGAECMSAAGQSAAPMLLLTRSGSYETTIAALEAGAAAAVPLADLTPQLLERSIRYAIGRKDMQQSRLAEQEGAQPIKDTAATLMTRAADRAGSSIKIDIITTVQDAHENGKQELQPAVIYKDDASSAVEESVEQLLQTALVEAAREKNRFKAVMQALPVGVAIIDLQGGIVEANPEYLHIWGGSHPETSSVDDYDAYKAWWRDTGERVKPEEWASARAVLCGETVIGQMLQIQRFSGERAFVINSAAPIFDTDGQSTGSAVVIMDITQQTQMEEALRESQFRLRIGLENSSVTVFSQDVALRYIWIYNPTLDVPPDNFLGRRDDEIGLFDDATELMAVKKSVIQTGLGLHKDITLRVNGDDRFYFLNLEPLLDNRQHVVGLRGSAIDITEHRKLMAQQMENIAQMEVHHRLLEYREQERQIIARELHDGPIQDLAGLIFHTQTIKEDIIDTALLMELEEIQSTLQHIMGDLREVTNELRPPSLIRFGLTKAIQNHSNEFLEKHPEIKMELHLQPIDCDVQLTEQINLSLFRIYQEAINNVVGHAQTKKIWVHIAQQENCIVLEVRDNGKGFIANEVITRNMQKARFGLAAMKERADAMGGRFSIVSELGKGTRILVKIPVNGKH